MANLQGPQKGQRICQLGSYSKHIPSLNEDAFFPTQGLAFSAKEGGHVQSSFVK